MRRFELPIAVFVIAVAFLVARLYDVQVSQHEIWAKEAANLVRSYQVEPYVRGALRDRTGRLIARDQEVYELEFVWRDFRRGHPLGQVSMAWSIVLGAPVALSEAQLRLHDEAAALVSLTPGAVAAFGKGAGLYVGGELAAPAADVELAASAAGNGGDDRDDVSRSRAAEQLRRRSRAGDLTYYLYRLLALEPREERVVRRLVEDPSFEAHPYYELASIATGVGAEQVLRNLDARLDESLAHLARLAAQLDWDVIGPPDAALLPVPATASADQRRAAWLTFPARERLVALIEARRTDVEDETADALFMNALGFPPWRFDGANLARLDLGWIDRLMGWNPARRLDWVQRRGDDWPLMVKEWLAGHVIARAKLALREQPDTDPADALLASVAHAFRADGDAWGRRHGAPEDWRRIDDLEGLSTLPLVLERGGALAPVELREALPFQGRTVRASRAAGADLLDEALGAILDRVATAIWGPTGPTLDDEDTDLNGAPLGPEERQRRARAAASERLLACVEERRPDWDPAEEQAFVALLSGVEAQLQSRVGQVLLGLDQSAAPGAIAVKPERIDHAEETRRYVVRDRSSRPKVIGREPGYELVHLVTRNPREFAGFSVRPTMRRERPRDASEGLNEHDDGVPVAEFLIGKVRHPYLVDLLRQRPDEVELARMQRQLELPDEDKEEILELVEASWHAEERMGGSGIEGWFDRELRGKEGYSEFQGLQDRKSDNRAPIHRPAEDGRDVWLTLDLELQRAVEALLRQPTWPRQDKAADELWFANPVGAIVLARTTGEILVAASTPLVSGLAPAVDTDGQRAFAIERTLLQPRFQPPGSIIKPIFAAYALQNLAIQWEDGLAVCQGNTPRLGAKPKLNHHCGWGRVDCSSTYGHSNSQTRKLAMGEALTVSCNTYFAALGELKYGGASMRAALDLFGIGRPTGVRYGDGSGGRVGLAEAAHLSNRQMFPEGGGPELPEDRQFIGNGLAGINANVVQMARAYAGIATGVLPEMRLVQRIGDEEVPPRLAPLPIDDVHLRRVRGALRDVVATTSGSGFRKGLAREDLGFALAGKTGSADYHAIAPGKSLREFPGGYMRKHAWFAGFFPYEDPKFVVITYMHDTSSTASHSATYLTSELLRLPELQDFFKAEGLE